MMFHVRGILIQMADSWPTGMSSNWRYFTPGAIHMPSMSPHRPVTSEDIADAAIGAAETGAAIVHPSAKDQFPETKR